MPPDRVGPVVTRLRDVARGRVAVELDGSSWRVLPVDAVVRAGLTVGLVLDRPRARRLRAELRRADALAHATRALRQREHTRRTLDERLARRGVGPVAREQALATLERTGLVDDARAARTRAAALADRGAGDLLIRDDLALLGVAPELIDAALDALQPEAERARRLVTVHGGSRRALRTLVAKGFAAESLDGLVAETAEGELGYERFV